MSLHDEMTTDLAEIFSLNDLSKQAVFLANAGTSPTSLSGLNFWQRSHLLTDVYTSAPELNRLKYWGDNSTNGNYLTQSDHVRLDELPLLEKAGTDTVKSCRFTAPTTGGDSPWIGARSVAADHGKFTTSFTVSMVMRGSTLVHNGAFFGRHQGMASGYADPTVYSYALWWDDDNDRLNLTLSANGLRYDFAGDPNTFLASNAVRLVTVRWASEANAVIRVNQVQQSASGGIIGSLNNNVPAVMQLGGVGIDPGNLVNSQWYDLFDFVGFNTALSDSDMVAVENFLLANSAGYRQSSPINIHFVNEFESALQDPANAEASRPWALCKTSDVPNATHNSQLIIDDVTYWVAGVQPYSSHVTKLLLSKDKGNG
jgi:hypothetical protein